MEAAEIAINDVPLTYNGKAGDRKEYKYCIDWLEEGEFEEKRRGGTLLCGLQGKPCCGQYNQCSMQATTACCPICLLLLVLKAFTILGYKKNQKNAPSNKANSLVESHTGILSWQVK